MTIFSTRKEIYNIRLGHCDKYQSFASVPGNMQCDVLLSWRNTLKSEDINTLDTSSVTEDVSGREGPSAEELRRQKRLVRNRISAERSRRRRLSRIEDLMAHNKRLQEELESLQAMEVENGYLKRQVELRENLLQLKCALQPECPMSSNCFNSSLIQVATMSQQQFAQDQSSKDVIYDVEKLCSTESQRELSSSSSIWSLGYEAPWLKQASAARAALARQLSNKSTHEIS
ncbi:hypothetical protein Gasu2_16750 [Galdieria sulphuraria]|nr:hypothetical protein Gasu2_16750 [Galdieria sulphuraria]